MEKDARHRRLVEATGGVFFPLVVDNFEVWTPSSIEVLCSVARTSTLVSRDIHILYDSIIKLEYV